jgi:hypothetical protein
MEGFIAVRQGKNPALGLGYAGLLEPQQIPA